MKKMKYHRLLLFAFLPLLFSSCMDIFNNSIEGNGNIKKEVREVEPFEAIHASGGLNVFIRFGDESDKIEVVADENLHEVIVTEVRGGRLQIKTSQGIRRAKAKDIYVSAGSLKHIDISSAADVKGENKLMTEDLTIDVSSAADLELELEADILSIDISSSGEATLRGEAREMTVDVSSAGDLDAGDLVSERCRIDVSSAGDARVHVTKELDADASSAGHVVYYGNPASTRINSSSAGSVNER